VNRPIWLRDARGWDHARVHIDVLLHPDLGAYEQYLYELLAMHAEAATGEPRKGEEATQARLAGIMKCSTRQVRRSFKILQIVGLVETYRADHRPGRPLVFRLVRPPSTPIRVPDSQSATPVDPFSDAESGVRDPESPFADRESGTADPESATPLPGKEVGFYTEKNETDVEELSQPDPDASPTPEEAKSEAPPPHPIALSGSVASKEDPPPLDLATRLERMRLAHDSNTFARAADRRRREEAQSVSPPGVNPRRLVGGQK
jgi:hypothetical protein